MSPATSTTRKRPARAAATTAPPEPDTTGQDDGLVVIPVGTPAHRDNVEQVPVFRYGDRTFTMPAVIPLQKAAKVLWTMREHDPISGGLEAVRAVCGPAAVDVLLNAEGIEDEHITRVIDKVTRHVFGLAGEVGKASDSA